MKQLAMTVALLGSLNTAAMAQTMNHEAMRKMAPGEPNKAMPSMTDGEVKKVDKQQGTITLSHGPIKSAGMPAMTMAYRAKDPTMLDKVSPGDKVGFALEQEKGAYLVTTIERK